MTHLLYFFAGALAMVVVVWGFINLYALIVRTFFPPF